MEEETSTKTTHLKFFGIPKIIPYLKPYKFMMLGMILLSVSASLIDIVFPKFQEYAINHYIGEGTLDTIRTFTVLYTALLLIKIAMDLGSTYLGNRVEMYMGRDLKQKSFDHLQTLSFSYFNQNSVGYIHSRVMSDTGRIGSLV